jgi:kinetochore protein Spc7/SPC105
MSSRDEATLPATRQPKSRQSIAHAPAESIDKENMTANIAALGGTTRRPKKLRSKSIGPGGLDALKDGTGNRRKVSWTFLPSCFDINLI